MKRTWFRLGGGLVLAAVLAVASPAIASFGARSDVGANTMGTGTLQAPSALSASAGCSSGAPAVTLDWTTTTSDFADGYDIMRGSAEGGQYAVLAHVDGRGASTYVNEGLAPDVAYFYKVRATAASWTSVEAGPVSATTSACP